jgi:hypothetical protein
MGQVVGRVSGEPSMHLAQAAEKDSYASLRSTDSLQRTGESTPALVEFSRALPLNLFEQPAKALVFKWFKSFQSSEEFKAVKLAFVTRGTTGTFGTIGTG